MAQAEDTREVLVVVLGAGASFDCLQEDRADDFSVRSSSLLHRPWREVRPPLTQDLVAPGSIVMELADRYPMVRPLVDDLRERLGVVPGSPNGRADSLEEALRDYVARRDANPHVARHLAAFRFFLRDFLWLSTDYVMSSQFTGGITNYTRLVRHLYQWAAGVDGHVCFVSFNYDTLLDQACADYWGLDLEDLDSYVSDRHASLLKPHGSIRWAWRVAEGPQLASSREAADHRIAEGEPDGAAEFPLVTGQMPNHRNVSVPTWPDLPAIALPVAGKSEFVWPKAHHDHFTSWQGSVRRLVTIGWRAAEPHFVDLLSPLIMNRHRVLLVTGGPSAESDVDEVASRLGRLGEGVDLRKLTQGFRPLFGNEELAWLLEDVDWPWP